jgi:hypothetical protein
VVAEESMFAGERFSPYNVSDVPKLDTETLNSRLLSGHRLLVTRDANGMVVGCVVEFFDEQVPVGLFNAYLANGMIGVPKDGVGFTITAEGKKRLAGPPGRRAH